MSNAYDAICEALSNTKSLCEKALRKFKLPKSTKFEQLL